MVVTREQWRHRLPHWEVQEQLHFITIRCANSLPRVARARIAELHAALHGINPNSPQFLLLQRQYFLTCEKFLDHTEGFQPFLSEKVCQIVIEAWNQWPAGCGWQVPHYVIMPNHVHFLMEPSRAAPESLRTILRHFKGHTARLSNKLLGRTGAFWQADWFDRWMRNKAEVTKVVKYIQNNPVKAGLLQQWQDYRWVK
jgi:REP element-mobilizing transposase RayT